MSLYYVSNTVIILPKISLTHSTVTVKEDTLTWVYVVVVTAVAFMILVTLIAVIILVICQKNSPNNATIDLPKNSKLYNRFLFFYSSYCYN